MPIEDHKPEGDKTPAQPEHPSSDLEAALAEELGLAPEMVVKLKERMVRKMPAATGRGPKTRGRRKAGTTGTPVLKPGTALIFQQSSTAKTQRLEMITALAAELGLTVKIFEKDPEPAEMVELKRWIQQVQELQSGKASPEMTREAVIQRAIYVIGDEQEALRWLGTPVRALGYATPIARLSDSQGRMDVMKVLTQLEHGVL